MSININAKADQRVALFLLGLPGPDGSFRLKPEATI
jgi:hypothetical protein